MNRPSRMSPSTPSYAIPILIFAMTAIALTARPAHAQRLPEELTFPRVAETDTSGAEPEADAASTPQTLVYSVDHTLFDKSYTGINKIAYGQTFGPASVEQGLWYELRRDKLQNTRHYLNATGSLAYALARYGWITPGLDWAPIAQYSSDRAGVNALSTIDIGPTAEFGPLGIPVVLRTGISGRRVDSLAGAFTAERSRSSVGAYGAFRVGSQDEMLPFAPVYFFADGIGRQIENSSMASVRSSALGALRVGERDSIFMYGDFSLFSGREGYLEGSVDSRAALFTETPWRVERNAAAIIGYKAARVYMFMPSVYYSVGENTLEFLNDTRKRDEKTLRQTLSGAVSTDSAAGLYYSGALTFEWRTHDKLFGRMEMPFASTSENVDSLEINLWDYAAFDPRTAHSLVLKLPLSFRFKYDLGVSRFLTEYPNFYVSGRDTVTNKDDSDRRTLTQRFALEYKNDSSFRAEVFGELTDYDLIFLKRAKSSSNRTDNTQKAGFVVEWSPASALLITEALSAEAKRGAFRYPEFHREATQRPRYSRAANSALTAVWQTTPLVGFSGAWGVKFSDYGFWYGREYMDSAARADYYAITSKSVYHTIDAAVRFCPGETVLEIGNAVTVARDRGYDGYSRDYILSNENGHSTKPYVNAAVKLWDWGEMSAHVSHTFIIGNSDMGYWDIRLQAEGGF